MKNSSPSTDFVALISIVLGGSALLAWLVLPHGVFYISTPVAVLGFVLGALRVRTTIGAIGVALNLLSLLYSGFILFLSQSF
jgi:hypothetical protein